LMRAGKKGVSQVVKAPLTGLTQVALGSLPSLRSTYEVENR
jgi:hypothetical protein